ncbi:MAG: peptidoglycan editing factor PgeF [Armatimonadetes bacterium]|nr:peptidoglycan editing factor PgeF [Armatimonadota bacterium]
MIRQSSGEVTWWQFEQLAEYQGLLHGVTSRHGGESEPPYDSLNLGLHVGDEPNRVVENRRRVCEALDVEFGRLTFGQQSHSDRVHVVQSVEAGRGRERFEDGLSATDGLVVTEPEIPVAVFVADCVPLILYDPKQHVTAVVHAGWRGTAAGIAGEAVRVLTADCGVRPETLRVGLGPAIGRCCYDVSAEVARAVGVAELRDGKWYADLAEANYRQLTAAGVASSQIELSAICTACQGDEFYSERRLRRPTGRFGAIAALR